MPSLSQLLTNHRSLLVLDAASVQVQIGLLRVDAPSLWRTTTEEAGTGIFTSSAVLLQEAGARLDDVEAFVFCEGPGSMLGVRTIAMAIRTWQVLKPRACYSYQSLAVAGHFEWAQNSRRSFSIIADARRDTWHQQQIGADGHVLPLKRVPVAKLDSGELVMPEHFRAWATPPRPVVTCSYDLAKIFPALCGGDFFRTADAPEAFQHEAPEYKKSPAQIHSLLTADKK